MVLESLLLTVLPHPFIAISLRDGDSEHVTGISMRMRLCALAHPPAPVVDKMRRVGVRGVGWRFRNYRV